MEDRYIEIEPYEEIVDRAEVFSTPSGSRSASPVSVDRSLPPAQSPSQGPSTSVYNTNLMTSVMRPDPRYELALASQVPHTQTEHPDTSAVAVTNLGSRKQRHTIAQGIFRCPKSPRNSNGVTNNGDAKYKWGRLKRRFSTTISLYLRNGAIYFDILTFSIVTLSMTAKGQ